MRALGESQRKKRKYEDKADKEAPMDSYDYDFEGYGHYEPYRTEKQQPFPGTSRRHQERYEPGTIPGDVESGAVEIKEINKEKLKKSRKEVEAAREKRKKQEEILLSESQSSTFNLEFNKNEITKGIIMSEILQVPRCKRPLRY